jgi:hypothetical protein
MLRGQLGWRRSSSLSIPGGQVLDQQRRRICTPAQERGRPSVESQPREHPEDASLGGDDQVDAFVGRGAGEATPEDDPRRVPVALGEVVALARLVDLAQGSRAENPPHDRFGALDVPEQEPLQLTVREEGRP